MPRRIDGRMQLLVITQEDFFPGEADVLNSMFEAGLSGLHLRKPTADVDAVRSLLEALEPDFLPRIVVHAHAALYRDFGLGGLHVPHQLLVERGRPAGVERVSCSAHSGTEVDAVRGLADRVFVSPVFDSISKPGYRGNGQLLTLDKPETEPLLVALGGVTADRLALLSRSGFRAAALMGYIWEGDPLQRFRACLHADAHGPGGRAPIDALHYITHPQGGRPLAQQVEEACRGGCRWIQLRMKGASSEERSAMARGIQPILRRYGARLIINDDVETAKAVNADGVHLGAEDMHPGDARLLLGPDKIIGCTANTAADMLRLGQYDIDYIGLGPFRFTSTKEKLSPVLGESGIRAVIREAKERGVRIPVIAIGGIGQADIASLMHTGIHGVAVSGAIHHADDPAAACRDILAQLENH